MLIVPAMRRSHSDAARAARASGAQEIGVQEIGARITSAQEVA